MRLVHGLRFAVGTLSVFPVRVERVDREVAGQAMTLAPAVGLVLGSAAGLPLLLGLPPLLGAALALGLLALLTRGLHLDGLADLADGLGSGKPAQQALDIMKKSDIGPFGVLTLVFTLIIQMAALAETGFAALVTACVAGRLALTWACRAGVPAARPDGLGAMVAGTVGRSAAWLATLAALLGTAVLGLLTTPGAGIWALDGRPPTGSSLTEPAPTAPTESAPPGSASGESAQAEERAAVSAQVLCRLGLPAGGSEAEGGVHDGIACPSPDPLTGRFVAVAVADEPEERAGGVGLGLSGVVAAPMALLAGLAAALMLLRRARRRLGGITGDVLGALVESAAATALVAAVALS
ncbi:adenosylcobinamide-GDP ribazoletransferase [Nonomuraea sp. NPDC050643]|uniref:adenosylcobinamide-GDP ribazoletransferase n=1 Tax=Nonomuraea sp. NPDC050643 TaxID=3155660 RepID=UPI0033C6A1C0